MIQLSLEIPVHQSAQITEIAFALGAQSVSECPLSETQIQLLILTSDPVPLQSHFPNAKPIPIDPNWETAWMAYYHGGQLTPTVWIEPQKTNTPNPKNPDPAHLPSTPESALTLYLDPSKAFGDGRHPTTQGCANILERLLPLYRPKRLLDIGTGSGILAIVAKKRGVQTVHALDIDPVAIDLARQNADYNHCPDIVITQRDITTSPPDGQYDIIIANTLLAVIESAMPTLLASLNPGGWGILSGVGIQHQHALDALLKNYDVPIIERHQIDNWLTVLIQKP